MSYQLNISPRARKAGRFISKVHKEIQKAFVASGLKQNDLAKKLEIDRSVVNRQLLGESNLTLRSISDLAWAMDCNISFSIQQPNHPHGSNQAARKVTTQNPIEIRSDSTRPITSTITREFLEAQSV